MQIPNLNITNIIHSKINILKGELKCVFVLTVFFNKHEDQVKRNYLQLPVSLYDENWLRYVKKSEL